MTLLRHATSTAKATGNPAGLWRVWWTATLLAICLQGRSQTLALKTNLLYDAALVPTIGLEFTPDSSRWSVCADLSYIWLANDPRHHYWRVLNSGVELRRWLSGPNTDDRSLTGHHMGLYASFCRYDFEFHGRGWLSDGCWGGGLSYGYAARLSRRLTFDFTIGIGYLGGIYKEYYPDDDCYVWLRNHRLSYFGPTRLEASLVWHFWQPRRQPKGGKL